MVPNAAAMLVCPFSPFLMGKLILTVFQTVHTFKNPHPCSASFLLERKASQVSVYEGPTDSSAQNPGPPSANGCKLGAGAWGVGQRASETGPGGAAWEQLVVEKGKKQLSLFLTFINPKIHKNSFYSRFLGSQEGG